MCALPCLSPVLSVICQRVSGCHGSGAQWGTVSQVAGGLLEVPHEKALHWTVSKQLALSSSLETRQGTGTLHSPLDGSLSPA